MLATLKDLGDPDDEATALLAARRRLRALARDLGRLTAVPAVRGDPEGARRGPTGRTRPRIARRPAPDPPPTWPSGWRRAGAGAG